MKKIFIAIAFLLPPVSFAQNNANENRSALIIGVGEYGSNKIPSLRGVPYDMESAKRIALAMGIPEKNIEIIRNSNATKENILSKLQNLGTNASEGSRNFVYFTGHGTRYLDNVAGGCVEGLLSYDGQAITNKEFANATNKLISNSDKVITMIDACYSEGVAPAKITSRSLMAELTPKFFLEKSGVQDTCARPSNQRSRGLLAESVRIGALQENVVQITSSRPDEISFDEPGKGGIATQAVRDCLLGKGKDIDASGAVSMKEVQQCAQEIIDSKFKNSPDYTPHHLTVSGNRNLIPVQRPKPPVFLAENSNPVTSNPALALQNQPTQVPTEEKPPSQSVTLALPIKPIANPVVSESTVLTKPPAISNAQSIVDQKPPNKPVDKPPVQLVTTTTPDKPSISTPVSNSAPSTLSPEKIIEVLKPTTSVLSQSKPPAISAAQIVAEQKPPEKIVDATNQIQVAQISQVESNKPEAVFVPPKIEPALASIATLKEIQSQGNPKRTVSVSLNKSVLRIGKDSLDMTIKSSHDGYVYLVLLGSDASSFYLLFPNGLDQNNRVKAGQTIKIPKADWEVKANGPSGTDNLLVMVADSPRKLNSLTMAEPTTSEPFTYALNDIGGRGALIDFLTGSGLNGKSESFGSALVTIKEVK